MASEWDYVLDEVALERLNAALWTRHGVGFFSHMSQDVLHVSRVEKLSLTSLPNGTDFENVMMTRENTFNLVRRAHEAFATVGWNKLKKNNRWDVCKKLAKKLGVTIGNVWDLLTNRIHSCKANTSLEIREVCRRLELILISAERCVESVKVFLLEYDRQVRDSGDARIAARTFLLDLDLEIENWNKNMSEIVLKEMFMYHANRRMWQRYGACLVDDGEQFSRSVPVSMGKDENNNIYQSPPTVVPLTKDETTAVERGLLKKLGIESRLEAVMATSRGVQLKTKCSGKHKKRVAEREGMSKKKKRRRKGDDKK